MKCPAAGLPTIKLTHSIRAASASRFVSHHVRTISKFATPLITRAICFLSATIYTSTLLAQLHHIPSAETGVDFVHTNGENGDRYIIETVVGSLALLDYDLDGWIDIYFVNGTESGPLAKTKRYSNRLYRNLGGWRFKDVTTASGLRESGYGMGVAFADYDNDGDPDLLVSNFGRNEFFVNQGDGTFSEQATFIGIEGPFRFGAGNSFVDVDGDGNLDLYCASYVDFDYSDHQPRSIAGYEFHPGPNDYEPAADLLFMNLGNGQFKDCSAKSGIGDLRAAGMGVLAADFDEDGDADIFVANDQDPNFLLVNDGNGRFVDEAIFAGVAFDGFGNANGNMGIDIGDIDGDGLFDLVTTTYQDEMPVLYQGLGGGLFSDSTSLFKIPPSLTPHVSWGVNIEDFDFDGFNDLFIACGHFLDNISKIDDRTDVAVANTLLGNSSGKSLGKVASDGSALKLIASSRASCVADLDNDGDRDVVVSNVNSDPTLARNDVTIPGLVCYVRLVGKRSNRESIGAELSWRSGRQQNRRIIVSGRSYESDYGRRFAIAVPDPVQPLSVDVAWPSGIRETFRLTIPLNPNPADSATPVTFVFVEGDGIPVERSK